MEDLGKAASAGISSGVITHFMYPGSRVDILGSSYAAPYGIGATAAAGSYVGDMISENVFEGSQIGNFLGAATKPVVTGGAVAAFLYLNHVPSPLGETAMQSAQKGAIVGALGKFVGDYAHTNLLRPLV